MKNLLMHQAFAGKQSLSQLWKSIAYLSTHVVKDNEQSGDSYPVNVRMSQLKSLEALIAEIKRHHHNPPS